MPEPIRFQQQAFRAEGEKIFSNSLQVKVLPPDTTSNSSNGGSKGSANSSRNQAAGSRITDKDLFMLATANKTTVHEQEAILLTYKLYSTVNLQQLNEDMPELTGFHTQEIDLPQKKVWSMEHYQGRNYNTLTWRQSMEVFSATDR